jgi:hypothetical protein
MTQPRSPSPSLNTVHPRSRRRLSGALASAWRSGAKVHRPLALSGVATAMLLALFVVGLWTDPRTIGGDPPWLKPTKFALSITVYTFTLLWLLGHVEQAAPWRRRLVLGSGWVVLTTFALEWVGILVQVLRGTTSHFNVATGFDAAIWGLMGSAIGVLFFANVGVAVLLLTQRFTDRALGAALRYGMAISLLGMAQAGLMTAPTARQMAGWSEGEPVTIVGAHSVGARDGTGSGLPIVGWRRDVGDLRVGHFVGLHALQVLPLVWAWLRLRPRLDDRRRYRLVTIAAAGYLGLTLLVTWQALRAQPLLQPDALTLTALALLVAATAAAAAWAVRSPIPEAAA